MASARFFAPLLMAASATAYVQAPLSTPKAEAFEVLARRLKHVEYEGNVFVGTIPYYPYAMDVGVGTPAQTQSMVLSLTHSDTFILDNDLCDPSTAAPEYFRDCSSGAFDDAASTTFSSSSEEYISTYVRRNVLGVMMEDSMSIGSTELSDMRFAVADKTGFDTGFLGLSTPRSYEDGKVTEEGTSILDQMAKRKVVDSPAFSIHAEEGNNTTGNILFGAVDKSKYDGKLQRIQASVARDRFEGYEAGYLANVSAVWRSGSSSDEPVQYVNSSYGGTFYAAIDPTFRLTDLPEYVVEPLYAMFDIGVWIWHNTGLRTVQCDKADSVHGIVSLELGGEGGYKLIANLRDLIVPAEEWHILRTSDDPTKPTKHCLFGIQTTRGKHDINYDGRGYPTPWVIGSMVLKNTYTVFDSKNMEVSLAPLSKGSDEKADIIPFENSGAHAPDSEFVGYEECFGEDCETEDEPDAGAHVVVRMGLCIGMAVGALGLIVLR